MSQSSQPRQSLTAHYESPSGAHNFSLPLATPASNSSSTDQKQQYFNELHKNMRQLQGDINTFLTQKMEEDKAQAIQDGAVSGNGVDEKKEEDNYGEEADDE